MGKYKTLSQPLKIAFGDFLVNYYEKDITMKADP